MLKVPFVGPYEARVYPPDTVTSGAGEIFCIGANQWVWCDGKQTTGHGTEIYCDPAGLIHVKSPNGDIWWLWQGNNQWEQGTATDPAPTPKVIQLELACETISMPIVVHRIIASVIQNPSISNFIATPNVISPGASTVLTATILNGVSLVVKDSGGNTVATSLPATLTPPSSTTYTLTVTGVAGSTPAVATTFLSVQSSFPITDSWTNLGSAGAHANNNFFNRPVIRSNGDIVVIWDASADTSKSGVWIFGYGTHTWVNLSMSQVSGFGPSWPIAIDGSGRPQFRWENCFGDWDDTTQTCFWASPGPLNFPANDDVRFDPATGIFTQFPNGIGGLDRMGGCWNGHAYMWGFASGQFNQIIARALPSGGLVNYNDTNVPDFGTAPTDQSGSPMGTVRGGIDHRTGMSWAFNNSNELWMRSLVLGAADPVGWWHLPTVGARPTLGCTFTLHEGLNLIIAYTGSAQAQGGDGFLGSDPSTTYILDLGTLVWRLGPALPATVPTPAVPQTSANLLYDRFNNEVKYLIAGGPVWRLDVGASQL